MQLQFGGAAGTLAGLEGKGIAVAQRMADELGLSLPAIPWHARRDRIAGLGVALAIVTGAVGKVARDISLLSQDESCGSIRAENCWARRLFGDAPQAKCDGLPNRAIGGAALSCAGHIVDIGMPQEHERGLGGWQAEAPVLAELFALTHGALDAMAAVLEGLEVIPRRWRTTFNRPRWVTTPLRRSCLCAVRSRSIARRDDYVGGMLTWPTTPQRRTKAGLRNSPRRAGRRVGRQDAGKSLGLQRRVSGDDHASCVERRLGPAGLDHRTRRLLVIATTSRSGVGGISSACSRGIGARRLHPRRIEGDSDAIRDLRRRARGQYGLR